MGHLIISKEVVKYFLRAVNLLLVGFSLKIRFSCRKQHNSLSRALWCLQSRSGSARYFDFAVSHLSVTPSSREPLEFTDKVTTWFPVCCTVPNTHLPDRLGMGLLLSSNAHFLGRIPSDGQGRWFITILHESKDQ